MCDILWAKIDCSARKINFLQKKHVTIGYFGGHELGYLTLKGPVQVQLTLSEQKLV